MSWSLAWVIVVGTTKDIHRIEDRINTLVTVLQYLAPLLGGLALTYAAMFAYVSRKIRANASNIEVIKKQTDGALDDIRQQVTDVHSATVGTVPAEHETIAQQISEVHDATVPSDAAGNGEPAGKPPAAD